MIFDRFEKRGNWVAIFRMDLKHVTDSVGHVHFIRTRSQKEEWVYNLENLSDFVKNTRSAGSPVSELIPVLTELRKRQNENP
jgi:hypothetical protein